MTVSQRRIASGLIGLAVLLGISASPGFSQDDLRIAQQTVRVDIDGLVATTSVEQIYVNDADEDQEATYRFRLPDGASVHGLAMWVDNVRCPAVVYPRATSRRIYRRIVDSRRDPAILEYLGRGRWHLRVFPIVAEGTQKVQIVFSHVMPVRRRRVVYEYPRVIDPLTEDELDFSARIRCPGGVSDVIAQTDGLGVRRERGGRVRLGFRRRGRDAERRISFAFVPGAAPPRVVTSRGDRGRASFLAEAPWPKGFPPAQPPRDVVFVVDASASMAGAKMGRLRKIVDAALKALGGEDRFAIVTVRGDVTLWRGGLVNANAATVAAARKYTAALKAAGGTDLAAGLRAAEACNVDKTRPVWMLVLTEGDDMVGAKGLTSTQQLRVGGRRVQPAENIRLNWFYLSSYAVMQEIPHALAGGVWRVDDGGSLQRAIDELLAGFAKPSLDNLRVSVTAANEVGLSDVAHSTPIRGRPISVVGRYAAGGEVTVSMSLPIGGRQCRAQSRIQLPERPKDRSQQWGGGAFEKILAHQRCNWLWDRLQRPRAGIDILEKLVALSRAERIVTRATAFLILETKQDYLSRGIEPAVIPLPKSAALTEATRPPSARDTPPETAERIAAMKRQAKALRAAGKYAESARMLDRVRKIDPADFDAGLAAAILREFVAVRKAADLARIGRFGEPVRTRGPWQEMFQPVGVVSLIPLPKSIWVARRPKPGLLPPEVNIANKAEATSLRRTVAKIDFQDTALGDVVRSLRKQTGLNIQVKWAALGLAGIDRTTAVNVKLAKVSLGKALRVILDDVGGGSTQLSYVVEDGVMSISTKEDLSSKTMMLVYNIQDLLPSSHGRRGLLLAHRRGRRPRRGSGSGTGFFDEGGGGGFFDDGSGRSREGRPAAPEPTAARVGHVVTPVMADGEPISTVSAAGTNTGAAEAFDDADTDDEDSFVFDEDGRDEDDWDTWAADRTSRPNRNRAIADLLDAVRETIDPTSWRTAGGEVGAVRELQGLLLVTQTLENHRSLARLLTQIRSAGPQLPGPAATFDPKEQPEALFTPDAQLRPWVLELLERVRKAALSKFSSVVIRKVSRRVLARIGGLWFDTALTAKSQVTLVQRGSLAAKLLQSKRPDTKPALAVGQSVILAIDETRAVSLDRIGIAKSDSADLKKLLPAGGK